MKYLRMLLGGCLWKELYGRQWLGIGGLGHDLHQQANGALWCPKCGVTEVP